MGRKKKYKRYYPFLAQEAPFIEEGIRPLVVALSQWDELKLMFSCEGHPEDVTFNLPYVAFKTPIESSESRSKTLNVVNELKQRIKGTGWGIFYRDDLGFSIYDPAKRKSVFAGYTLRPYKRRKRKISITEIAELVRPKGFKKGQEQGIIYYHSDEY